MKKWIKILLLSMVAILLLAGAGLGYLYYQYQGKYSVNENKYPHSVGYLNPKNQDFSENFRRCDDGRSIGFYHSSAPNIYRGSKRIFINYVQKNYRNNGYSDNGFLNLRFIINCRGEIGDIEINELDEDLKKSSLHVELVDQITKLSFNRENWQLPDTEEPRDAYMYLIYKIENGEIVEILP